MTLPRLYAIVDMRLAGDPIAYADQLFKAGVRWLQLRDKENRPRATLSAAREIRRIAPKDAILIVNDRADLCLAARFDGVHLGQEDLSPEGARRLCPAPSLIGVSTHNLEQLKRANAGTADYLALGPIFETSGKRNPGPAVGLKMLREARKFTPKPLVAIGGITRQNCRSVIEAGADSVAVISDLLSAPKESAKDFLRILS